MNKFACVLFALGVTACASLRNGREASATYGIERENVPPHLVLDLPDTVDRVRFLDDERLLYSVGGDLVIQSIRDRLDRKVLHGHGRYVADWDVSPDGKRIASTSSDGTVRLWDARTGAALAVSETVDTLSMPSWFILQDVMFSRDGRKVYTGDMDGIRTWSAKDCRLLSTVPVDFYMREGFLAPDAKSTCAPVVMIYFGFEVMEWGGESLYYYQGPQSILGYSPDGRTLLVAEDESGNMFGYDVPSFRRKNPQIKMIPYLRPGDATLCAAYSPDGRTLVSGAQGGMVYVWDVKTGLMRGTFPSGEESIYAIAFDRSGTRFLVHGAHSNRVHVFDLESALHDDSED